MQGANSFRVDAYRRAAATLQDLPEPVAAIFEREGLDGLQRLPGIGDHLSVAIRDMILTGRYPLLEHLRGEVDPVKLLQSAAGVGRIQAERLHRQLGIDTLEELEAAAHSGRLQKIPGFGPKRITGIIDSLASRLDRLRRPTPHQPGDPPVDELLDVDREYRAGVLTDALPKIAPRRFNPNHDAWLPILHTERDGRHYTALFSNTARAHELGKTADWVVLYHEAPYGGRPYTVITSNKGPLQSKRIVRGREAECIELYEQPMQAGDG
jgi:putative hydrolase